MLTEWKHVVDTQRAIYRLTYILANNKYFSNIWKNVNMYMSLIAPSGEYNITPFVHVLYLSPPLPNPAIIENWAYSNLVQESKTLFYFIYRFKGCFHPGLISGFLNMNTHNLRIICRTSCQNRQNRKQHVGVLGKVTIIRQIARKSQKWHTTEL